MIVYASDGDTLCKTDVKNVAAWTEVVNDELQYVML
jgi:hypothetical protein